MPLVSFVAEVRRARTEAYAVALFDTFDLASTEGMLAAIERERAPTIVGVYSSVFAQPNARALCSYLRVRLGECATAVSLMLDHGTAEQCRAALEWGFTDVMFDGSQLALAENSSQTAAVVEAAHAAGVGVEAELGHVGAGLDYESFGALRLGFTDPAQVERFVADTGVDFLAVAVGTAHGVYHGEPHLDAALVSEIRRRTEVPLVLHGGTGLSEEQVRSAIRAGIAKVNIATDLYLTAGARLGAEHRRRELGYGEAGRLAAETFRERAAHYLRLFGSAGKG